VLSVTDANDVDAIELLCQDELMRDMLASLPWPYTREHAEHFATQLVPEGWASGDSLTWSIRETDDGPHLGSIGWRRGLHDIGFWMGSPYRGRGYMTEAVGGVCDWVFAELGEERIAWEALVGNTASARVARAAGFRFDGERASDVCFRDGKRPAAWHAVLERTDDRAPHDGWPL